MVPGQKEGEDHETTHHSDTCYDAKYISCYKYYCIDRLNACSVGKQTELKGTQILVHNKDLQPNEAKICVDYRLN